MSSANLQLLVLAPDAILLRSDHVRWVQLRLADGGGIGIWPGHAPLLAETVAAPLQYADDLGEHSLLLDAGVLQVSSGRVVVYAPATATGNSMAQVQDEMQAAGRLARLVETLRVEQQPTVKESAGAGGATQAET